VRLHIADDDIDAAALQLVSILQYLVGLADAGSGADVQAEPRPLALFQTREERLG
jgi:hypothetical protein